MFLHLLLDHLALVTLHFGFLPPIPMHLLRPTPWFITAFFGLYALLLLWQPEWYVDAIMVSALLVVLALALAWLAVIWVLRAFALLYLHLPALVVILGCLIYSLGIPRTSSPRRASDFSVLHINALSINNLFAQATSQILEADADVCILHEYGQSWLDHAPDIMAHYPYVLEVPLQKGTCCYGLMIGSKFPILEWDIDWFWEGKIPIVIARLAIEDSDFHLITTHTRNPMTPDKLKHRQEQLIRLAEVVNQTSSRRLIVTGDLNITPWERGLISFEHSTGLRDVRHGSVMPTFPSGFPFLPIDYQYYGAGFECLHANTVSVIGSDHLGIMAYYRFAVE